MSIENIIQENTEAVRALTQALKLMTLAPGNKTETPVKEKESEPTAQAEASPGPSTQDLAKEVKKIAAEIVKQRGKEPLKELLSAFGVTKVPDLQPGQNVFEDFIKRGKALLENAPTKEEKPEEVDPLGEDPEVQPTFDDVKNKLLEVINRAAGRVQYPGPA